MSEARKTETIQVARFTFSPLNFQESQIWDIHGCSHATSPRIAGGHWKYFAPSDFTARKCFGDVVVEEEDDYDVENVSKVVESDLNFDATLEKGTAAGPSEASEAIIKRKRSTLLRETIEPLPLAVNTKRRSKAKPGAVTPSENFTRPAEATEKNNVSEKRRETVQHAVRGSVTQKNSLLWRLGNANVIARTRGGDFGPTARSSTSAFLFTKQQLAWVAVTLAPFSVAITIIALCSILDANQVGYVPTVFDDSSTRIVNITRLVGVHPSDVLAMQGRLVQVCVGILAVVMTVSVIAIQLSAQKMSTELTRLVLHDILLVAYIFLWTVVVGLHCLVYWLLASAWRGLWSVFACYVLAGVATFLLFPFLAYLFTFLQPEKIVARIMKGAVKIVSEVPTKSLNQDLDSSAIFKMQDDAVGAAEDLAKLALTSMINNDKSVSKHSIDALCYIAITYGDLKDDMVLEWFDVAHLNVRNPDFNSLSEEAVRDCTEKQIWLEYVILGQYQLLFNKAMEKDLPTTILGVLIDVRLIAEVAFARGDYRVVHLVARYLNTFLMRAINKSNWKVASSVSNTYRRLGLYGLSESTIKRQRGYGTENSKGLTISHCKGLSTCENSVCDFMRFLRYYLTVVASTHAEAAIVCGILTHDAAEICEAAFVLGLNEAHDELLRIFLTFDDQVSNSGELIVTSVRRGQIKLATKYLVMEEHDFARKIASDMLIESSQLLSGIRSEIIEMNKQEFWEITDRGKNLNYFSPAMVSKLDVVTNMVEEERLRRQAGQNPSLQSAAVPRRLIDQIKDRKNKLIKGGYSSFRFLLYLECSVQWLKFQHRDVATLINNNTIAYACHVLMRY